MSTGQDSINEQLRSAIWRADRPLVDALLGRGARMDWRDQNGISTLHYAAEHAKPEMLGHILSRHEADVSITDDDGQTPMHYAARAGKTEIMELLKNKGAKSDAEANDGRTPLMLAAHRDHAAAVEWLLAHKADPNRQDHQQRTALHYAVSRRYLKSTILLVKAGANPHIEDHNHMSPIELATRLDGASASAAFGVSQFLNALEVQKDIRHGTPRALPAPKTAKFTRKPQAQSR